jgi:hypothetical protein
MIIAVDVWQSFYFLCILNIGIICVSVFEHFVGKRLASFIITKVLWSNEILKCWDRFLQEKRSNRFAAVQVVHASVDIELWIYRMLKDSFAIYNLELEYIK